MAQLVEFAGNHVWPITGLFAAWAAVTFYELRLRNQGTTHVTAADLLLPVHVQVNGVELRMFSTIMTLGTPRDVTLQELRIETFFPADAGSEAVWKEVMGASG